MRTTAKPADSQAALAAHWRILECSPEPIRWATGMAKPLHMPVQKPITKKLTEPVEPTAARAWEPSSLPTIMVSTTLYICWNSRPSRVERVKPRISRMGLPLVRSLVIKTTSFLQAVLKNLAGYIIAVRAGLG